MALLTTVALLRLHLVDDNLLLLAVLLNSTSYSCALNIRSTNLQLSAFANCQNLVKCNGSAVFNAKLLNVDYVTFGYLVLLATGYNKCIQCGSTSLSIIESRSHGGRPVSDILHQPGQCGFLYVTISRLCCQQHFGFCPSKFHGVCAGFVHRFHNQSTMP